MSVAVVHIVRAGPAAHALLKAFVSAYRAMAPGIAPTPLVLACKGFDPAGICSLAALYRPISPSVLAFPDTGFDHGSYRRACLALTTDYVCFLNSYSRPLVSGWLDRLYRVASRPEVGIAGATGSHEIEPHVRTNAFCLRRQQYLSIVTQEPSSKMQAYAFETGARSLTREVRGAGLAARIVGRDGDCDLADARELRTFRWGGQSNLLVADNRTDDFAHGDRGRRQYLQQLAWGRTED